MGRLRGWPRGAVPIVASWRERVHNGATRCMGVFARTPQRKEQQPPMTLIVNPWHWLTPDGELPTDAPIIRRNVLRVARVIEYGATLPPNGMRETLIECTKRPAGKACRGLLWVEKLPDDSLLAYCPGCETDQMLVHTWQETQWAEGQAEPLVLQSGGGGGEESG